jgi:GTP-binding protein
MFFDEITVHLKAGKGGDGCMSFRREKYIPEGGPNGGDGGRGGNITLVCDHNVGDLTKYHFKNHYEAKNGEPGRGNQQYGHYGDSIELPLPPGTIVYDLNTGRQVAELLEDGQKVELLRGGKGGLGNIHFKSSTNQAPRKTTLGELGEEGSFRLELKTMADIGLVGFPNAGKSSLLNAITDAHPKMAAYPFTTLFPNVGVIHYPDYYSRLYIADIPGLIVGASENKGLGHRFLRHIERCPILIFILDMAGEDGRDPLKDYTNLLNELNLYDPELLKKPHIVAANKMDEAVALENLKRFKKKHKTMVQPISCLSGEGLDDLKNTLWKLVKEPLQ